MCKVYTYLESITLNLSKQLLMYLFYISKWLQEGRYGSHDQWLHKSV